MQESHETGSHTRMRSRQKECEEREVSRWTRDSKREVREQEREPGSREQVSNGVVRGGRAPDRQNVNFVPHAA